ncbi:MAG: hypothetical protein O2818_00650 [Bacteroidetes bacterium]|nr:hypothetical protein [Bacteroidota bacterium]MDA1335371.1 hypothetical protein [Bacteroidota bacterium]
MWNNSPAELEAWYRRDAKGFQKALETADPNHPSAATWQARLDADLSDAAPNTSANHNFNFAIVGSIGIALIFLVPYWVTGGMEIDWAVPFLAPLAFGPMLVYHGWRRWKLLAVLGALIAWVAVFYNLWEVLPSSWRVSDVISRHPDWEAAGERINFVVQVRDLMMIHWPILLLGLTGLAFVLSQPKEERVDFVRHAVQVGILSAIIVAAGGALLGLTNLLMLTLDVSSDFNQEVNIHLITWGLSGILIFGHSVWMRHPKSLERILPTVARIFIPLFVVLEFGFLLAYLSMGFDTLSSDREELLVFNFLLIAVIGLVMLHSAFDDRVPKLTRILVVALVVMGIVADVIGIAAIMDRLIQFGITPNRLTVLGSNLIFLVTLATLSVRWFQGRNGDVSPERITRKVMNRALAVFMIWTGSVIVIFPMIYGWRLNSAEVEQFEAAFTEEVEATEEPVIEE